MEPADRTIKVQTLQSCTTFTPGMTLGSYRILRKIGAGGMGAVYEVEHVMLHQHFALKTLFVQGDSDEERQDCIDRFLQEARITSQLRHPGIVSVQTLDQDKATGALYFVMDYVSMTRRRRKDLLHSAFAIDPTAWRVAAQVEAPGERGSLSLEELYQYGKRIGRRMNPELVRALMMDIAQALDYAHNLGSGIIHRDIKPANILIQENGHAVLADFGVAKIADSVLRKSVLRGHDRSLSLRMEAGGESYHLILGTVEYMAPELRTGSPPSSQTDLYALGATLYQLLVGELPSGNTANPSDFGLDSLWDEIIQKCLAVEPSHRYPSLKAFYLALANFPQAIRARRVKKALLWAGGIAAAGMALLIPLSLLLTSPARKHVPDDGLWVPHPAPHVAFQFIEHADHLVLKSVHPDICGQLEIPSHVDGKPITQIAPDAFQACTYLNAVYLPGTLSSKELGLTPVKEARACAEPECAKCKLHRSILANAPAGTLPYALSAATVIPKANIIRPGETFSRGASVTHENITYRLEEQGWVATKLNGTAPELLLFPDMIGDEIIYKIGGNFCGEQTTLRRVTFPRHLREIGDSAFSNVGIAGELRLPETVTAIRHAAFAHNRNITKIIFPPKLEILEQSAFQNTLGLEKVELPETLKHFGDRVFCGTNLDQTHFRMPKCVTRSDKRYYWYLGEKIQTIEIPSISHFQYDAITLQGTARGSLTLQFNSPTVEMDTNAIRLYLSRHKRVTLQFREGAHVTLHENFAYGDGQQMSAFPSRNCRLAVRIGDKESVWDGARFVGEASFIYAGRNTTDSIDRRFTLTNNNTTFHRLHDKECKHFDVPKGIREIKSEAFNDTVCESLSLPRELNRLGTAAFKGMEKLKTITLPASINWSESHYDWLFDLCFNLERIIIHSSLPKWEIGMFAKCRKLKYIVLAGNQSTQPTFVEKPLWDEENLCKPVHVILFTQQDPQEANSTVQNVQVLKLAPAKKDYVPVANEIADSVAKIVSAYNARSDRPPFLTHLIPELDKLFQVTAPVEDQSKSDARTEPSVSPRVTQVNVIRAGETFSRGATVTHENVTYQLDEQGWVATKLNGTAPAALVFPNRIGDKNIYKIGDNFCGEQTTLRHVTFPRYLREIGEAAFSNVGLAGELHLPEMVTAIRRVAFAHNRNITKIIFPPKLEILEQSAFQNTENLEKVKLPETLKHYGDRVFCGTILDQTHFRIPRCVTRSDGRFYWFLGETIKTIEIPSVSHFQTNAIQLHGTGKGELTLQFNSPKVEIDNKAICVYFTHHRKVTLQFREGAEVNLDVGFIHGDGQPMSKFAEHNCRLAVRIGDKESIWDGIQFIGDADFTYAGIRTAGFSYAVSENYTIFHRLHDIKCKHFNLPQKTVRIKGKAFTFTACESISLPNTLKYLETCSFQRMEQLKTITLPASINWEESTYDWLFDLCFNLERIIIHSSLPEWQNGMFAKCRKLKYIVLAGNQSTQPTFDGYPPLRDIEKLCKPVHVILFTQQDPQQANSKVQDVQVLKLAPGKKDYEPVANEIADSVAKIVSAYNARSDRPPFLTHLIPELDALFQVTAPVEDQSKPSPTTKTAKPKPVALKPSSTTKTAKPKPTQEDVKDINDPGMEGWLPIDENPKSTNKTSADNPFDSHSEEELTSSPTTEKSTRKRLGVFSVESSQKELRIVKCNQATGSVTLPRSEYPGQRVVVEADAFANCQLLILEVLHNDVTFKANALRDARIKNILFFDRAPVFTILAFNGIRGDFPECQIYTNGIYEPAFVSTRALRFLRPDPDKPALFLFDYGESQSKALSIPESFNHNRRRHKLYLLPGAFKNCPNLETISLAAPNWTTPDVFKDISKLNKITVPRAHATEAKKLQRELEGTDIMVNFR